MRTRPSVALAALIAAFALVAQPGPAGSNEPGTDRQIDPTALRRLALPGQIEDQATASPTLDPSGVSASTLDGTSALTDVGALVLPSSRPSASQPDAPLGVVIKPTPTPKPAAGTGTGGRASGGSWIYDPEVSWYGPGFYGNRTACGLAYTTTLQGVAHRSLPCGTLVTFRNPANGRSITVPVIDRGPYVNGRTWDLSGATCTYLDHCYTGPIQWRYP